MEGKTMITFACMNFDSIVADAITTLITIAGSALALVTLVVLAIIRGVRS
jgi:hypothetical protein